MSEPETRLAWERVEIPEKERAAMRRRVLRDAQKYVPPKTRLVLVMITPEDPRYAEALWYLTDAKSTPLVNLNRKKKNTPKDSA